MNNLWLSAVESFHAEAHVDVNMLQYRWKRVCMFSLLCCPYQALSTWGRKLVPYFLRDSMQYYKYSTFTFSYIFIQINKKGNLRTLSWMWLQWRHALLHALAASPRARRVKITLTLRAVLSASWQCGQTTADSATEGSQSSVTAVWVKSRSAPRCYQTGTVWQEIAIRWRCTYKRLQSFPNVLARTQMAVPE